MRIVAFESIHYSKTTTVACTYSFNHIDRLTGIGGMDNKWNKRSIHNMALLLSCPIFTSIVLFSCSKIIC